MEFPTNIKCFFENNALHDYEVGQISINYSNGTIILNLISDKCEMIELTIEHFKSISFTKDEPWGKGKYIVSSDAKKKMGEFILEFQLNSGDSCTMTFA